MTEVKLSGWQRFCNGLKAFFVAIGKGLAKFFKWFWPFVKPHAEEIVKELVEKGADAAKKEIEKIGKDKPTEKK